MDDFFSSLLLWSLKILGVILVFLLNVFIFLKFFYLRLEKEFEKLTERYGEQVPDKSIDWSGITITPIFEECLFRGPVLLSIKWGLGYAILMVILISFLFAILHKLEAQVVFEKAKLTRPWVAIVSIIPRSLGYGGLVVLYGSLWPAIVLHLLWNNWCEVTSHCAKLSEFEANLARRLSGNYA